MKPESEPQQNTDVNLYRDEHDEVFRTVGGGIGINHAGRVVVKTPEEWVEMAWPRDEPKPSPPEVVEAQTIATEYDRHVAPSSKCAVCRLVSRVERLVGEREDARNYAAEIAQGVTHYPHDQAEPCVRCERDSLRGQLEEANEKVRLLTDDTNKMHQLAEENACEAVVLKEAKDEAEKERDLLRDKWKQMEAYGFDSPSQVFKRLEEAEKRLNDLSEHAPRCGCEEDPRCLALRKG